MSEVLLFIEMIIKTRLAINRKPVIKKKGVVRFSAFICKRHCTKACPATEIRNRNTNITHIWGCIQVVKKWSVTQKRAASRRLKTNKRIINYFAMCGASYAKSFSQQAFRPSDSDTRFESIVILWANSELRAQ